MVFQIQPVQCKIMDDTTDYHLETAQQSYQPPDKRKRTIGRAVYDPLLSDKETAVYADRSRKKTYTAFRGTANVNDVATDIFLGVGALKATPRYKRSKRTLN